MQKNTRRAPHLTLRHHHAKKEPNITETKESNTTELEEFGSRNGNRPSTKSGMFSHTSARAKIQVTGMINCAVKEEQTIMSQLN